MTKLTDLTERVERVENDSATSNEHDRIMFYEGGTQAMVAFEKCLPFLPDELRQQVNAAMNAARDVRGIEHRQARETPFKDGWKQTTAAIIDELPLLSVEVQKQIIEALERSKRETA